MGPVRDTPNPSRPARNLVLAAIGFALVACLGARCWRSMGWESTDNAQIDGFIYPVSSRIFGHVTRVMVDENQYVEAPSSRPSPVSSASERSDPVTTCRRASN